LSKRTNLYTSYVRIDNKNSLVYTTKAGDGSGDKEFNVGIRHKF
jgi:predicted porin